MRRRVYLSAEFLTWPYMNEGGSLLDVDSWRRAYEIWEHARAKLHDNASEMDRVDAITTLKRCLNQRLKEIEKNYKLRSYFPRRKKYLQMLEECGLVRPLILQDLMEIRNLIEHEDKRPPRLSRCLELLDVTWYFLRSTDSITRLRADSIIFRLGGYEPYWISLEFSIKRTWKFSLRGWLPENAYLKTPQGDYFEVLSMPLKSAKSWKDRGEHLDKEDGDLHVNGDITRFPRNVEILRYYFSAF